MRYKSFNGLKGAIIKHKLGCELGILEANVRRISVAYSEAPQCEAIKRGMVAVKARRMATHKDKTNEPQAV